MKRIVVAMSGATGAIYGVRLLEALQNRPEVETHLVVSQWAEKTIALETGYGLEDVKSMAGAVYDVNNLGAAIASGSYATGGMVIAPCSMKTLSAVAHGFAYNLIARAADVMLKEHRKLVLVVRETPLSAIHLENMLKLANLGVVIMPPVPAFYNQPVTIDDLVNHYVGRIMNQLGLDSELVNGWEGITPFEDRTEPGRKVKVLKLQEMGGLKNIDR